jgi:hypothetical protein
MCLVRPAGGAQTATMITRLPDDIEQHLLDGQPLRATHALMARRGLTLTQARTEIDRWVNEWSTELRADPDGA